MGGLKTTPLHSCGKSLFQGGVYGVGAPRQTSRHTLEENKRKGSMVSLKVDWNVLKPIMAKCNEQFHVNFESPKDRDKGFRHKNDVRVANSSNKGSRLVIGIKYVLGGYYNYS